MQTLTSVHYFLHQATAKKGEIKFKVVVAQMQLTEY